MRISIIAIGHKLPAWIQSGYEEYAKRMPPEARLDLIELKPEDRANRTVTKVLETEATRIESAMPRQAELIVLDERGSMITTRELASMLTEWMRTGVSPCFVIGSADGIAPSLKQRARKTIALSGLTLPHAMVRVMLAEALYRAWTLNQNHPYHRE
jgi:23S rRNA (pseudouridine1915-N3)-methyltransferase